MPSVSTSAAVRRAIRIEGTVQGVGFRPAIVRLARSLDLAGCLKSEGRAVAVEVEGAPAAVARFLDELSRHAPPHAHIDSIEHIEIAVRGETAFVVVAPREGSSLAGENPVADPAIPADLAPCDDCLRDILDPSSVRHRDAFASCAACGPRYSIADGAPFDRATSSMAAFPLCAACARAYEDPRDRHFRAAALSCRACGPKLTFLPTEARGDQALDDALRALASGRVVAVKGAGGFHLVCDAANDDAVRRLRQRKRRPDKPFAVLVRDVARADALVVLEGAARRALTSAARPFVVAPQRPGDLGLARGVAPGWRELAVALPPTPLLHLLAADAPHDLVITSGNPAGEVIALENEEAIARLDGIADAFLFHDRAARRRVDDSVVRALPAAIIPVRRSRGTVPDPFALPVADPSAPPLLALGGDEHAAACLASDGRALVSQRVGDLDNPSVARAFVEVVDDLCRLAGAGLAGPAGPEVIVHDLDPDLRSTRTARALAEQRRTFAVAHQHAHVAACLVDNGRADRVLGVVLDGPALGSDGTSWGGDVVDADLVTCRRVGHLRPLALCGGHAAVRAPWRLAYAALLDAGERPDVLARVGREQRVQVEAALERGVGSPVSTSAARWIDAVASLCGLCDKTSFDAQAAMLFEQCADAAASLAYPFQLADGPFVADLRPCVRAIADDVRLGVGAAEIASRFHETLAAVVLQTCRAARKSGSPSTVALTGSCFVSRRLLERVRLVLESEGFEVLRHRRIPANDAGLSLGQAAVATARLSSTHRR